MLPEPEVTSSSTVPLTCRVRSKWPVVAAFSGRAANPAKAITRAGNLTDFISPPEIDRDLLQDNLLAFLQAGQKFCLGTIGNSHGYVHLLAPIFRVCFRYFH